MFTQWTIPFVLRPKYFILPSHVFHFLRLLNQILVFQSCCHGKVSMVVMEDISGYHLDVCIGKPAQVTYKPELLFNRPALGFDDLWKHKSQILYLSCGLRLLRNLDEKPAYFSEGINRYTQCLAPCLKGSTHLLQRTFFKTWLKTPTGSSELGISLDLHSPLTHGSGPSPSVSIFTSSLFPFKSAARSKSSQACEEGIVCVMRSVFPMY